MFEWLSQFSVAYGRGQGVVKQRTMKYQWVCSELGLGLLRGGLGGKLPSTLSQAAVKYKCAPTIQSEIIHQDITVVSGHARGLEDRPPSSYSNILKW